MTLKTDARGCNVVHQKHGIDDPYDPTMVNLPW